jgi:hypothetical protein
VNRPALSAIAYRIGTYGSFRQTMLERIAVTPELAPLTIRRDDDHAIAVVDLWAAVADVLTFYQERYANEAFLRTATRRESITRLARLIDYHAWPGIAALTNLAFTVEAGKTVEVPVGLRVQSVPGQDEQPQVFETLEAFRADARLNRLRVLPAPIGADPLGYGSTQALLAPGQAGLDAAKRLAVGDRIMLFGSAGAEEVKLTELRTEEERVTLAWDPPVRHSSTATPTAWKAGRTFRLFGHNAPPSAMKPTADTHATGGIRWDLDSTTYTIAPGGQLPLDARYEGLQSGTLLLVVDATTARLAIVVTAKAAQSSLGGLSDTVTQLGVWPALPQVDRRTTTVHELVGTAIPFWGHRYPGRLQGPTVLVPGRRAGADAIEVGGAVERLELTEGVRIAVGDVEKGRRVLVGDASTPTVPATVEAVAIADGPGGGSGLAYLHLDLALDDPLDLDPETAYLLGNVAESSHGETVRGEVLGDGDAGSAFQRFALRKPPLTYLSSAKEGGCEAAAEVRVNGIRWREARSLYGRLPTDEVFTLRQGDDGSSVVQFGDGTTGARPATGSGNVVATYRTGSGLAGRVRGGTLTSALDRPPGLKEVTNPLAARGGANAEPLENARENAPQTVRTFGRAVSLRDFEDLARASGEVAKARATWVWDGLARAIHLTVAGQAGAIFAGADLARIASALHAARDPNHRLRLANHVALPIVLRASVEVDLDHVADDVIAAARAAALAALAFDVLRLGEPLHLSDMYAALQGAEGVVAVDIDEFQPKRPADRERPNVDRLADGSPAPLQPHIRVYPARPDPATPGVVLPAELGTVEDASRDLAITPSGGLAA